MKIKEGGGMDIQELRQFESVYKPSKEVAFCWLRKQYVQLSTEENHTEIVDHANDSLRIWQAAKAQADQKVKLLLCDEHLKKCESPTGIFNSQYPDEEPCLICLAKQAKAQAVPAQLDVNSILHDIDCYFDNGLSNTERTTNNLLQSIYEKLSGEVKAQEPAND